MPEARRCGQTQHLREKRRRALLVLAPNDGVIEFDHTTSLRGLHQPALRDRRPDDGSEERMAREGLAQGFDLSGKPLARKFVICWCPREGPRALGSPSPSAAGCARRDAEQPRRSNYVT